MSTCGAAQPAGLRPGLRGAAQRTNTDSGSHSALRPAMYREAQIRVGSFNFGIDQEMLTCSSTQAHCEFVERVCSTVVEVGELDILLGCEVCGFNEGFQRAGLNVEDVLPNACRRWNGRLLTNHVAMWDFGGASALVEVPLHGNPYIHTVPVSGGARSLPRSLSLSGTCTSSVGKHRSRIQAERTQCVFCEGT